MGARKLMLKKFMCFFRPLIMFLDLGMTADPESFQQTKLAKESEVHELRGSCPELGS